MSPINHNDNPSPYGSQPQEFPGEAPTASAPPDVRGPVNVTVIMPIRNEQWTIRESLGAVLSQDYPSANLEVIVVDGMSTDHTKDIVHSLQKRHPNLRLLDNPGQIVPTGLNAAIRQAKGDVLIRVDGHCTIAPDYIQRCVQHLQEDGVDCVGGPIETVGSTYTARAIALAMSSKFGVGGSAFRTVKDRAILVDTVPFAAYTRQALEKAGPFDEELVRNQDDEYNFRLRKLGGKILLSPDIRSRYYSRSSLRSLWRQYHGYGFWKVRVMQKHPQQMSLRQFVPALFVLGLLASIALGATVLGAATLGAIDVTGGSQSLAVTGAGARAQSTPAVPTLAAAIFGAAVLGALPFLLLGIYGLANLAASLSIARREGWRLLAILPVVYAILHFSYGFGFLAGLVTFSWRSIYARRPIYARTSNAPPSHGEGPSESSDPADHGSDGMSASDEIRAATLSKAAETAKTTPTAHPLPVRSAPPSSAATAMPPVSEATAPRSSRRAGMISILDRILRRTLDITISSVVMIIFSPFFLLIAVLVKRDSPGPVFYRGPRLGKNGRVFQILKFRTMYEKAESHAGPRVTAQDDPRITPFGHFLRDTKINELPQFWNVFIGEMSLVGPRPEDPLIAARWPADVQHDIFSVRPGITSPASVIYRNEETLLHSGNVMGQYLKEILPSKLRLDQLYVRNRSVLSDLDVLLWTALLLLPSLKKVSVPEHLLYWGPLSRLIDRYLIWLLIDMLVALTAIGTAGVIWRIGAPLDLGIEKASGIALVIALLFSLINTLMGLNQINWKRSRTMDAMDLALSSGAVTTLLFFLNLLWPGEPLLPPSMLVVAGTFAFMGFVVVRYRSRLFIEIFTRRLRLPGSHHMSAIGERILIVGSGELGQMAARLIRSNLSQAFNVVGMVDDDPRSIGQQIDGCKVMGNTQAIPDLVKKHDIGLILFSISRIRPADQERILALCQSTSARVMHMPEILNILTALFPSAQQIRSSSSRQRRNDRSAGDGVKTTPLSANPRIFRAPAVLPQTGSGAVKTTGTVTRTVDGLAELYDHDAFLRKIEQELHRARRYGRPFSIVLIKVETQNGSHSAQDSDAEMRNDSRHAVTGANSPLSAADASSIVDTRSEGLPERSSSDSNLVLEADVLESVAQLARQDIRAVDILGRYDGSQLALALPETGLPGATRMAERIARRLAEPPIEASVHMRSAIPDAPGAAAVERSDGQTAPLFHITIKVGVATAGLGATADHGTAQEPPSEVGAGGRGAAVERSDGATAEPANQEIDDLEALIERAQTALISTATL